MKHLLYIFFILCSGCKYKLNFNPIKNNEPEDNNTTQVLYNAITADPNVDYITPFTVFSLLSFTVFLIAFFPFFCALYSFLKKKILTLFKK